MPGLNLQCFISGAELQFPVSSFPFPGTTQALEPYLFPITKLTVLG
jgi:hypothetical protein